MLWGRLSVRGRNFRWSLETDKVAVARQRREARRAKLLADRYLGENSRTFEEAQEQWDVHVRSQIAGSTLKRYVCSLVQLAPYLVGLKLSDIDVRLVGEIVQARSRLGITAATVRRDFVALSSVMNFAVLYQWCDRNPVLPWLKNVKERREPIVLPRDVDIRLVMQLSPGMWPHLVHAAWVTGAREDELVSSRRSQLNHESKTLTVIGKGRKRRVIDLKPMCAYEVFANLPTLEGKDWLFWRTRDKRVKKGSKRPATFRGDQIDDPGTTFSRIIGSVAKWAVENAVEFRPFRFHDLRHRHAVDWLAEGRSIYGLKQRLRHSSVRTTEIYLEFRTGDEQMVNMYGRPNDG